MTKQYILIMPDEEGNPINWIELTDEPGAVKQLMEDYGVEKFITKPESDDPNYWAEGEAMLLEVKILEPKPVQTVTEWKI